MDYSAAQLPLFAVRLLMPFDLSFYRSPLPPPFIVFTPPHAYVLLPSHIELLDRTTSKMFIGGLNWDTTDGTYIIVIVRFCSRVVVLNSTWIYLLENLRKYFSQFGKVEACTIMRDAAGRSRCFAFLTFEDPASVNAVMVREHFLDGKIVSGWE